MINYSQLIMVVTLSFVAGCASGKVVASNDSVDLEEILKDDSAEYCNTISPDNIQKIQLGQTMKKVEELLGPPLLCDGRFPAYLYFTDTGDSFGILFFDFLGKEPKPTGVVTGLIFGPKKGEGWFLLPKEIKGKSYEEVMKQVLGKP